MWEFTETDSVQEGKEERKQSMDNQQKDLDETMNANETNISELNLSSSLCNWSGFGLDREESAREFVASQESSKEQTGKINANGRARERAFSPTCDGEEKTDGDMLDVVREFLLEKTSLLYNDVVDAQGEQPCVTGTAFDRLQKRYETLQKQTAAVLKRFRFYGGSLIFELHQELENRFKSIEAALRKLSLAVVRKPTATATLSLSSSDSGRSSTDELGGVTASPLRQWREWVESIEKQMNCVRQQIDWFDRESLEQCFSEQQALQDGIEHDGGRLVGLVQQQIASWPSSHRRQIISSSVDRRWHGLWIKSLEWQCRIEMQINYLRKGFVDTDDNVADQWEPLTKRARLDFDSHGESDVFYELECEPVTSLDDDVSESCSVASDTIPFSSNEYESLSEKRAPTIRDGGYSSQCSTILSNVARPAERKDDPSTAPKSTGSSPCLERRKRIENSPVKQFYKMTPPFSSTDKEDAPNVMEKKRGMPTCNRLSEDALYVYTQPPPCALTDSLLVQVGDGDSDMDGSDFEEILNLLDASYDGGVTGEDAFEYELDGFMQNGSIWVSLEGGRDEGEDEDDGRDQRTPVAGETPPNSPLLRRRENASFCLSTTSSLKRRRQQPKSFYSRNELRAESTCNLLSPDRLPNSVSESALLMSSSMISNASTTNNGETCTEKNENAPRRLRKKLRARRMPPRSMSDGENVAAFSTPATRLYDAPTVPPCTPDLMDDDMAPDDPMIGAGERMASIEILQTAGVDESIFVENPIEEKSFNGEIPTVAGGALGKPRSRKRSAVCDAQVVPEIEQQPVKIAKKSTALRQLIRRTWPIQLCILACVCVGVFVFHPSYCEDEESRYYRWWNFGPSLDYVRGPPPA